ncbi:kinesin-domain-containing protein [Aspergillus uvarum CBS 121591]|uniref:Kinesin-like protein n=1 Tax=Aspergillus uvarum CBS 121591 TaxID=1448315 RepID=A0A319BRP4_9EURO|nr:kinesin-domain-containing protein [Aspergillus uvarum CBS 121591]PYH75355.1 kinesin-domain-containing protein [Aspergillus uvarum CBS 121591]
MTTQSRYPTRKAGRASQKEGQAGSARFSQRAKTSQNRKTGQAKDSCTSTISESREHEPGDKTAIYVTVRCRSRNERETTGDHSVILRTDGIKGKTIEVSMDSPSNKIYNFDQVFSSAADQRMVYEDTVLPMVDELLLGYNCTIFAYGQTGTGKTYTMFGDMTEEFGLLSDNAGIIPRTLYTLFDRLKGTDTTIKCSFIELYNEVIHDLLSGEEDTKLHLFENERNTANRSLLVKGMQESYIDSPSAGIQLLRMAGRKRQVAATKCNDLSSRSHTIFTINILTRSSDESITCGKLNLVDLAGSENIQRSGAENKRAVEAGQINKSLLTLGRVINALVDRSSHVPYRESKLTRLLQDSLGGNTRTCIIATVSPCRSSQEETASTLDYAFRAKNIHNRPQINTPVPKDTLLSELSSEIETLKRNLRATRHRNGIYMTPETYEDMIKEIESRRIVNEEQKQRVQALESGFQHKAEELLALRRQLLSSQSDKKEAHLKLSQMNDTINKAQTKWEGSIAEVSDISEKVGARIKNFQAHQTMLLNDFSTKISQFFGNETMAAQRNQTLLYDALDTVENAGMDSQTQLMRSETEEAFQELKRISKQVRVMISKAMIELPQAISRMSEGLQGELSRCKNQFDMAYSTLDTDVQSISQMIVKHIEEQNTEISELQLQLQNANSRMVEMSHKTSLDMVQFLEEERTNAEAERHNLLTQIGAIYDLSFQQRWDRLQGNYSNVYNDISSSGELIEGFTTHSRIEKCITRQKQLAEELIKLRNNLVVRMGQDKETIEKQHLSVQQTAASAQRDLRHNFDNHKEGLDGQLELWAQKLEKTQSQNKQFSDAWLGHLKTLGTTMKESYSTLKGRFGKLLDSSSEFQSELALHSNTIEQPIATLEKEVYEPLSHLRTSIRNCLLPSGSLRQASDYTTPSCHPDTRASSASLAHKGSNEQHVRDKSEATQSNQESIPRSTTDSFAEQPYLALTSDDSDQPRPKRRRL